MLGKTFGSVAVAQATQALQVRAVERRVDADRQADAMHRQCEALVQARELGMREAAVTHVVFRMHLEETDGARIGDQAVEMLGLEFNASAGRQRGLDHGGAPLKEEGAIGPRPSSPQVTGVSEPVPFGVFIVAHVPFATYSRHCLGARPGAGRRPKKADQPAPNQEIIPPDQTMPMQAQPQHQQPAMPEPLSGVLPEGNPRQIPATQYSLNHNPWRLN